MHMQRNIPPQVLLLISMLPLVIAWRVAMLVPFLWGVLLGIVMLGLAAVAFALLWRTKPDDKRRSRQLVLYGYACFLPLFAVLDETFTLARTPILQQFGLDTPSVGLLGIFVVWPILVFPAVTLLRRKAQREHPMTDAEKEFKQTIRMMPTGWGMTPEETINRGHFLFLLGVIIGGGNCIVAGAFAIHIGISGLEPAKNIIYFSASVLYCFAAICTFFFCSIEALKCWRIGRRWREQAAGTITIQGTFAGWWIEQEMNNKTLIKIQRKDGSSKMLLVGTEFDDALPEIGEDVQIDYLCGCEAVIDVKPLATAPVPAADS